MSVSSGINPVKAYMLMMGVHRLLYQAWWKLHWEGHKDFEGVRLDQTGPAPQFSNSNADFIPALMDGHVDGLLDDDDLDMSLGANSAHTSHAESGGPGVDGDPNVLLNEYLSTCPDDKVLFSRPERVRAKRAGLWISDPLKFMEKLLITLLSTTGTVRLLYYLLREQKLAAWTGAHGLDNVPMVQCCIPGKSPAVFALDTYAAMMNVDQPNPHVFGLLEGLGWFSCGWCSGGDVKVILKSYSLGEKLDDLKLKMCEFFVWNLWARENVPRLNG